MKVVLSWLRDFVDVPAGPEEIAARMSVRGFAVEGLERLADGDTVIDGGGAAFLGIMPSQAKILGAVRQRVARRPTPDAALGASKRDDN